MENNKLGYYKIRKSVCWMIVSIVVVLFTVMAWKITSLKNMADVKAKDEKIESVHMEYGNIESKLLNTEECYLCGSANKSLMGYYRKFDTVGIIGLNDWYVLDLRLKEYDEEGNQINNSSGTSTSMGNTSGMDFNVNATPSRGMTSATISSTNGMFHKKEVQDNLCQKCLDKITDTLEGYFEKGKEEYQPFCLVDFATLDIYPLQKMNMTYSVRDYLVELEHDKSEIEIDVYYLPVR